MAMTARRGSPWIAQLERKRPAVALDGNETADTVVVGGGISGLATAFFLLRDTDREVVLLEKDMVAHGATGHNAGQAVAAMEARFDDMVAEVGEDQVLQGCREVLSGWDRLEEVIAAVGRPGDLVRVEGVVGLDSPEAVAEWTKERQRWLAAGAPATRLVVAKGTMTELPEGAEEADHEEVLRSLRTTDRRYIAALRTHTGMLNSAVLTEAMAEHLLSSYPDRFRLYERSEGRRARLGEEVAVSTAEGTVIAQDVVLCTNGYTGVAMEACEAPVVLGNVHGVVGFMVGRFGGRPPGTEAFFRSDDRTYYYLTRRAYAGRPLMCVGGPELALEKGERYDARRDYDPQAYERLDAFARSTVDGYEGSRDMEWQGLMGYTPGGLRLIGRDPENPNLLYNLGCNGIGLLASFMGGWKVAQLLRGAILAPSMFDPDRLARSRVVRIV